MAGVFPWPQWQPLLWASCSVLAAEAAGIRNTKLLILQIARHGAIDCHMPYRFELQMAPEICNAFHIKRIVKPGQHSVHIVLSQVCCNKLHIVGCVVVIPQNELSDRSEFMPWYFVSFNVQLICTRSVLLLLKCQPKISWHSRHRLHVALVVTLHNSAPHHRGETMYISLIDFSR